MAMNDIFVAPKIINVNTCWFFVNWNIELTSPLWRRICLRSCWPFPRNGFENLPFCPGSLQDTFIIFSSISHQHIYSNIFFEIIFPEMTPKPMFFSNRLPGDLIFPEMTPKQMFCSDWLPGSLYFQKWPRKKYFAPIGPRGAYISRNDPKKINILLQ